MLDAVIRWSLANRAIVVFIAAGFLVWGGFAIKDSPLDVLPDLTAPTVTVITEASGMAPVEMEALVTFPIESAMNGATGVRRVRSATAVGVSLVWVEFNWGEDVFRARQVVSERLTRVTRSLPSGVDRPVLAPVSSIMGEIMFIALQSSRHDEMELRTAAEAIVRRRLLSVPGVTQVIITGGSQKQYQVLLDPILMRSYGVTLGQVEDAIERSSRNTSAGFRVASGQEYLIQGVGRATNISGIESIGVASYESRPVFVRDLARVSIGGAVKRSEGSRNGEQAIVLGIQRQPEANTLTLTRTLDDTLESIARSLPAGMTIDKTLFRQADFIERALANLTDALRDGALLVVLVVVLFLFSGRAAFVTLLALPLSIMAALTAMHWFGFTINSMTLGGLAIAIGELVDDAIIDVENVLRRLRENAHLPPEVRRSQLSVVYEASREIRGSVVFATLLVVLVFIPLFLLTSVEGLLLKPLGVAYVVSLVASLVVALTVTPVMCSYLLPGSRTVIAGKEPRLVQWLKAFYRPILGWALGHPRTILVSGAALVAVAGFFLTRVGRTFLPDFNEGALTVSAGTLPGTSLADSNTLARLLEKQMLTVPEVASVVRRTGRAEMDEHVLSSEASEIDVRLKPGRPRNIVLADLREKASAVPGMIVTFGQPISHRIDHMMSGTRAAIAVKIFGDDLQLLRSLAQQVRTSISAVPGAVDLFVEPQMEIPIVRITPDALAAARHGLQPGEIAARAETAFWGREAGRVFEGQLSYPIVVRYESGPASQLSEIRQTLLDTPAGVRVPLGAVANVREDRGPNFIQRENAQRKIVVQCNVAGRDLRSVVTGIQEKIAADIRLPQGYRIEYGGQFESEAEASRRLLIYGAGVICAMIVILASAFGSTRDALIVLINLPLALVGGVAGVYWGGGILSVASIIGFIALFGIASRNGIMLVSHIRHLMSQEGVTEIREAVFRGAMERLAPILMTALAAGLALIPIAARRDQPGSEIQGPMALVILFGLFSSTLLNMVVTPAVYLLLRRKRSPK